MPFAGLLAVVSILAQNTAEPADFARSPEAVNSPEVSVWQGGEVPRCPESLRLEGSNRPLVEVPETWPRLADKTGGLPGWVVREAWPVPCVSPAGR